jgi:putative methyltransferase (TIGR04325 family)
MDFKYITKQFLPPVVIDCWSQFKAGLKPVEWEYLPEGWPDPGDPRIKGWDVESVARVQKTKFSQLLSAVQNGGLPEDARVQHTLMAYAYVLTLAARMKHTVSMLDWGGGLGFYGVLARALVPGITIDYHCLETPALCKAGREVLAEATFYENEALCLQRHYDLVLASGALQCFRDWKQTAERLVRACKTYLFITRMPVVRQVKSFVVLQKPYQLGYETEYPNWFLNRQEFIDFMKGLGVQLTREFLLSERPIIHRAPEQCEYRGYLFSKIIPGLPDDH